MDQVLEQMDQFYQENPMLVVSTIMLAVAYIYYSLAVVSKPTLYCRKDTALHSLVDSMPIVHEVYKPTFWCWEPRLQSMLASFIRQTIPDIKYKRELFTFSDGGEVGLDWMKKVDGGPEQPIVLLLPGYYARQCQLAMFSVFRYHRVFSVRVHEGSGECRLSGSQGQVCRLQF